ncbi:MAG: hypothetical protein IJ323_05605 [Clostridia bacterium]|nr:hypothetical protein [Clostridia bacterium]
MTKKKNIKTESNNPNVNIKRKIGSTTYMVTAHFNDKHKDDIATKIKKLITKE